ncbi:F510_1955 family glycosylhydrolase [Zhihengliuella flava]|uniref:Exo-alpha-sialidase n=1 Tax=Zhihengliuella flava TaxID=1285193 RepID=A0A931DBR4_9MICC|nr:exo-alpha-sialidase [Zhihengliuella flava]MBG6084506.1 hypothetical protein [Zhihengliuella flava]
MPSLTLPSLSRSTRAVLPAALSALLLSSCAAGSPGAGQAATSAPATSASVQPAPPSQSEADSTHGPADVGHIHGIHPDGDRLLIATHHGLFVAGLEGMRSDGTLPGGGGPTPRGPQIDLMGFAASDEALYASGHPGAGSELPNPVGLMRSTDDGATWEPLSRAGESDFHALTTTDGAVVGFDGNLARTQDGVEWEAVDGPDAFALAGHPAGPTVLATTPDGLWVSEDAGQTWAAAASQPDEVLQFVTFADADTAVGIAPDGSVHVSEDAGASWEERGLAGSAPSAVAAQVREGQLHVWAAVGTAVVHSDDGGARFS